jgi:hypothetical protein
MDLIIMLIVIWSDNNMINSHYITSNLITMIDLTNNQ